MIRRSIATAGCLAALLADDTLRAGSASGGDFSLEGRVTPRTGRTASGGSFAVDARPGTAAPGPISGGDFNVSGGLVVPAAVVAVGDFELVVSLQADGQIHLDWPAEATGYVLETTQELGSTAAWQPVTPAPAGNSVILPANQPLRFFRLRQP